MSAADSIVIDCDSHVMELPDLWEKYLEPKFRDRAIRIVKMSDTDSSMKSVLISDARDPHDQNTITAKRGAMLHDSKNKSITLGAR